MADSWKAVEEPSKTDFVRFGSIAKVYGPFWDNWDRERERYAHIVLLKGIRIPLALSPGLSSFCFDFEIDGEFAEMLKPVGLTRVVKCTYYKRDKDFYVTCAVGREIINLETLEFRKAFANLLREASRRGVAHLEKKNIETPTENILEELLRVCDEYEVCDPPEWPPARD